MRVNQWPELQPGEWVQPVRRGYRLACCGCGLVHCWDFRIVTSANGGQSIQFRLGLDNKATAACRRSLKRRGKGVFR